MKKSSMFEKYPDVVEVDDLRKMLGGISRRLAYRLLPKVNVIEYVMDQGKSAI